MNGLTLAYLGDSYYEFHIRKYLLDSGMTNVNKLHKKAISYTSGTAQAKIIKYFIDSNLLTEDEITIFKRGRNSSGPGRKNIDSATYHLSTGFEALIGMLTLTNEKRVMELINLSIAYINQESGETV
ncbi:conserved hypothetical protein [Alteracholeplasma palmae J233]|uniref:Mini-ribonuclease 3 n=1 Tax=Alteracholeplasma palmae (strain ATCC 49389 / J233) TaxID=1318466 RepID=U4KLL9_ALTPJ|nr:ribonuclease III domain-containing protein [Alteracholeplasma palmae]CCV64864.1 conserved hypothetical protein [Alteracholeplasma palmae J233]